MSLFTCERCGYATPQKSNLIPHFRNKTKCNPVESSVAVDVLLERLCDDKNKLYVCAACNARFTYQSNLSRHKKTCKGKPTDKQQIEALEREVNELKELVCRNGATNNITNNNMQNNINIHINVRDLGGQENTKYLDNEFLMECFKDMDLVKVLEELHFNPEHPENHNVRLRNVKQNLMEYADQGRWIVKKKDKVLYEMVMNGWRILDRYSKKNKEEIEETLDEDEIREAIFWLRRIYDEGKELFKKIKEDIYELVMTNKELMKVK